jgi:hypothetical protein
MAIHDWMMQGGTWYQNGFSSIAGMPGRKARPDALLLIQRISSPFCWLVGGSKQFFFSISYMRCHPNPVFQDG